MLKELRGEEVGSHLQLEALYPAANSQPGLRAEGGKQGVERLTPQLVPPHTRGLSSYSENERKAALPLPGAWGHSHVAVTAKRLCNLESAVHRSGRVCVCLCVSQEKVSF